MTKASQPATRRQRLVARQREHLYRTRRVAQPVSATEYEVDGARLLAFCSNDYLGLAQHAAVIAAFIAAANRYGVGAGASHLVNGHSPEHHALEEELADFVGAPRALLFSTGYMANLGVAAALTDRHSTCFEDKLNHASLLDAARQHGAHVQRYAHGDVARLSESLRAASGGNRLILTDGVFSMDGDVAPLPQLMQLARTHDADLLVDDAHALGVLGAHGRGSFEHCQVAFAAPAILMGTLGKAFGSFGAFVAGDDDLVETLIQDARTYIYTTALPPAVAAATRASLKLVRSEAWRRERLRAHIERFRREVGALGLRLMDSPTPIQPIVFGEAQQALAASAHLHARGIWVSAIRPPTVPANAARLRITLSAAHSDEQLTRLIDALASLPRLS